MVLFKHGVAFLERSGPATGPFELSFEKDEMNDVLKSLSVWVAEGDARVGAIGFDKPDDPEQALAEKNLSFAPGGALSGLLASARGRRVRVMSAGQEHSGEVLGVESVKGERGAEARSLVLRVDEGRISVVDLGSVTEVDLLDPITRAGVAFLADRSRAATSGESRTVLVDLEGTAADVRVSYVIPAPTWRVSYRVAREGDDVRVMGWGLVHNPADEDLEDIELVLTTGQPVSFVIDLYNPKEIERTVVEEESRAVAAPTRFERAKRMTSPAGAPMAPPPPAPAAYGAPQGFGAAAFAEAPAGLSDAFAAGAGAAEYADRGELFEYRITERVSLKRGGSAMVPLFSSKIPAEKQRIWRLGAPPAPDLVLRFENASGAVLEEGPAVIYDDGVYAGESMVPYSARGAEVKLGFAKDLGVRCSAANEAHRVVSSVSVKRAGLFVETRIEVHHQLTAESDHAEAVTVIFELPKIHGRQIDPKGPQPFEDTSSFRRFKVDVPANSRAVTRPVETWIESSTLRYDGLAHATLLPWVRGGLLDEAKGDALRAVLDAWAKVGECERQKQRTEKLKLDAFEKQKRISEQLAVLKDGGAEGTLRLRYVAELSAQQDRVNALDADLTRLDKEAETARRDADERLAALIRD